MIQDILLPICRVMTFGTIIPQLLFMCIILFMAVKATVRQRFVLPLHMTLLTFNVNVFSL